MTISNANWTASSDPFRQPDLLLGGVTIYAATEASYFLKNGLNLIHDKPDVQRIVLQENISPYRELSLDAWRILTGPYAVDHPDGMDNEVFRGDSGNSRTRVTRAMSHSTGSGFSGRVNFASTSPGADNVRLVVRCVYHWTEKDPAQIVMAMLHHHLPSTFGGTGLRDFMNQASFEDASGDFTAFAYDKGVTDFTYRGLTMSAFVDVGSSVKGQVEDLVAQTVDWVGVRPAADDGKAELHYIRRDVANIVDTVVDFDNTREGIKGWRGGVNDDLRVDQLKFQYGFYGRDLDGTLITDVNDYIGNYAFPMDHNHQSDVFQQIRRHDGIVTEIDLPNLLYRDEAERHWQLYFWGWEQQEFTFEHGPRHFNYEVGDVIKISSKRLALDGTQHFLVYDKDTDYDTGHARVRVQRVYGFAGTRPDRLTGASPDLAAWLRAEDLQGQARDTIVGAHLATSTWTPRNSRDEQWNDISGRGAHGPLNPLNTRGTGLYRGSDDAENVNEWGVLDYSGTDTAGHGWVDSAFFGGKSVVWAGRRGAGPYTVDEPIVMASNGGLQDVRLLLFDSSVGNTTVLVGGATHGTTQLMDDLNLHTCAIICGETSDDWLFWQDGATIENLGKIAAKGWTIDVALCGPLTGLGNLSPHLHGLEVILFAEQSGSTQSVLTTAQLDELDEYLAEKYRHNI